MSIRRFSSRLKLYFYLVFSKQQHGIITFQISEEEQRKIISGRESDFDIYFSAVDPRVIEAISRKLSK